MENHKLSGRQILEHFANRLEAVEASLPSLVQVKQLAQSPSDVAELDRLRNSYEGEPIVFPAMWVPSWSHALGTSSVLPGLQRLLSGIVQVDVFQLQYGTCKDEECRESFEGDPFKSFAPGCWEQECTIIDPSTRFCILRAGRERCDKNLFDCNISTGGAFSSDLNTESEENSHVLAGKSFNVDLRDGANVLEESICASRLYHPLPSSISEVIDFGAFVSELNFTLHAQRDQLLYLTWRGLPALKKLDIYSNPTEFQFFIRNLFHPTTSPHFVPEDAIVQRNLWIGAMVTSRIHFDALDNVHVCLSGKKLFHLYSPLALPYLYPKPWKEGSLNNFSSMESIFLANQRVHADFFQNVQCWHTEVKAGEAIFIPAGWWHEVFTFQETVSANIWFSPNPLARFRPTLMHLKSENYYKFMLRSMGRRHHGETNICLTGLP